MNTVPIT